MTSTGIWSGAGGVSTTGWGSLSSWGRCGSWGTFLSDPLDVPWVVVEYLGWRPSNNGPRPQEDRPYQERRV